MAGAGVGGARSKSLSGDTMRLTLWDLSTASTPVELTSGAAVERFVFVVDGAGLDWRRHHVSARLAARCW